MADIIFHIEGKAAAPEPSYTIRLSQASDPPVEAILASAQLTAGPWTPATIRSRVTEASIDDRGGPQFKEIAETLWHWLLPEGAVRDAWAARFDLANPPAVWLRFRNAGELAGLPWELAYNPETGDRLGSACGLGCLADGAEPAWDWADWPFRILVLAGSGDPDGRLKIAEELAAIDRTLLPRGRSVQVVRLDRPTRALLAECVEEFRPHVLHFAGHGDTPPGGDPGLLFETSGPGGSWTWTGEDIRSDLGDWGWVPRFVFLNACRTATGPAGTWNAQQAFLARGVRAAIGMQADMVGNLAGLFAAEVYRELAAESTLAAAVVKARRAILNQPTDKNSINYAIPRLVAAPGLRIFRRRPPPADPGFLACREFAEARFFADCSEYRRRATRWFYPPSAGGRPLPRALVLTGEAKSGKSHLLKWCMETWAFGEARVRYLELGAISMSFLDVLRQIRLGEAHLDRPDDLFLHAPLPPEPFRRYRWELENLLAKGVAGEWVEAERAADPPFPDEGGPLPARGDKRLEPLIADRFREALEAAAGGRPLILVFDHFSKGDNKLFAEDFRQLVWHLFTPLAKDPASKVRLVFCATAAEALDYGLEELPRDHAERIELPVGYTNDELVEYAVEAFWFQQDEEVRESFRKLTRAMLEFPLTPGERGSHGLAKLGPVWKYLVDNSVIRGERME